MAVGGFRLRFNAGLRGVTTLSGQPASYGGASSFVEYVAEHIVGDVGHADLHCRPADTNGSDKELHLVLLPGEHMLDGRPDLRSSSVRPRHRFRHWFALRLSLVDVRPQVSVR
jgi:hypothetical protein